MKHFYSFLMLTLSLCLSWGGANAQQSLPYSYGFENNNLATDGWLLQGVTGENTGIGDISSTGSTPYEGSLCFVFEYVEENAYLLSPIFTGDENGIEVSFYYQEYSGQYGDEQFQVGYTTDASATDASTYTYGEIVTASEDWQEYSNTFPAGTKRIAIKYIYTDAFYLFLDDFTFEVPSSCIRPTNMALNYTSGNPTAEVSWTSGASAWNVNVNGIVTHTTSNPYTISGLLPATTYTVKVQADCGSEQSGWVTAGSFSTPCPTSFTIPYTYDFEDEAGIYCWSIGGENYTGVWNDTWAISNFSAPYARSGKHFFFFTYTEVPPQWLISPELSGITNGLHVQFYYRQYTSGTETFRVGYSTTNDNIGSFTWGDEITASTSYQRFSADYPAETKYVAVEHTSDNQYYLFLDDFTFKESTNCHEPTGVTAILDGTHDAEITWTAGGDETSWEVYITSDPDEEPGSDPSHFIPSVFHVRYLDWSGSPATTYYFYVRAICSESEKSEWSAPAILKTQCEAMSLPYEYDFEDDNDFEHCWSDINTNASNYIYAMDPGNGSSALLFYRRSSSGDMVAVLPEVDGTYPLNEYQITFDACWGNNSSTSRSDGHISIGIMTDPEDISTFEEIEALQITEGYSSFGSYNVMFNSYTGSGHYIAIMETHTENGFTIFDNIQVTKLPICNSPTDLAATLDGQSATLTWTSEDAAFEVAHSLFDSDDPNENIDGTSDETTYTINGLALDERVTSGCVPTAVPTATVHGSAPSPCIPATVCPPPLLLIILASPM